MDGVRKVVLGVVRATLRERGLAAVVVLRPGTAGHDLVTEWLAGPDGATGATVRSLDRAPAARDAVVLDPAPKEVVLLDGPLPGAEVLPLADVWGSRVAARDPRAPLTPVERALAAAFEGAEGLAALDRHLPTGQAASIRERVLRTAALLRAPVVPKLSEWTPGIDPGP